MRTKRLKSQNSNADWRLDILSRACSDKNLGVNALRILMYLLSMMELGEMRYVPIAEIHEELEISSESAVSIAFRQLTVNRYIKRVIAKDKKTKKEIELLAA